MSRSKRTRLTHTPTSPNCETRPTRDPVRPVYGLSTTVTPEKLTHVCPPERLGDTGTWKEPGRHRDPEVTGDGTMVPSRGTPKEWQG